VNRPVICGVDDSSVATGAIEIARDLAERYRLPLLARPATTLPPSARTCQRAL
jgi:hypothetical protein